MHWIIDFIIVTIIVCCAIRGFQRGLVLAVFGALTMLVALAGAWLAASFFSHYLEGVLEAPVASWVDSRMENFEINFDRPVTNDTVHEALRVLGINEHITERIDYTVAAHLDRTGYAFQNAAAAGLTSIIANTLTFLIAFVVLVFVLRFAAQLLDTIAQLPLLNIVNKLGGLGGGLLQGVLIVWLCVTALSFLGVINPETAAGSFWLRRFY